jgi:hypothetical protein
MIGWGRPISIHLFSRMPVQAPLGGGFLPAHVAPLAEISEPSPSFARATATQFPPPSVICEGWATRPPYYTYFRSRCRIAL